jgi:DNA-binding XRE family transcriptional regulator
MTGTLEKAISEAMGDNGKSDAPAPYSPVTLLGDTKPEAPKEEAKATEETPRKEEEEMATAPKKSAKKTTAKKTTAKKTTTKKKASKKKTTRVGGTRKASAKKAAKKPAKKKSAKSGLDKGGRPGGAALELGPRLKTLRDKAGVSQREMAAKVGVSTITWFFWESGKNAPSVLSLINIINGLELSNPKALWLLLGDK